MNKRNVKQKLLVLNTEWWGVGSPKDRLQGSSVDGSAAHVLHLRQVIFIIMCIRRKSVPRNKRISTAEVVY